MATSDLRSHHEQVNHPLYEALAYQAAFDCDELAPQALSVIRHW